MQAIQQRRLEWTNPSLQCQRRERRATKIGCGVRVDAVVFVGEERVWVDAVCASADATAKPSESNVQATNSNVLVM
jgi:hypothetical protein